MNIEEDIREKIEAGHFAKGSDYTTDDIVIDVMDIMRDMIIGKISPTIGAVRMGIISEDKGYEYLVKQLQDLLGKEQIKPCKK